jgi:hypothetical protein
MEKIVSRSFALVMVGLFVFYLGRGIYEGAVDLGPWKIAAFVGLGALAYGLARLKKVNGRLYPFLQVFFGLGAVLAEISKPTTEKVAPKAEAIFEQTSHGLNLGWGHSSLIVVAVLVVAEGFAAWRETSRSGR